MIAHARSVLGELSQAVSFSSHLNNDGSPLQLCLSARGGELQWRLIGDPHSAEGNPWRRFIRAKASLFGLLDDSGSGGLEPAAIAVLRHILPPRSYFDEAMARGAIWLARPWMKPGAAFYANARWGRAEDRWVRVGDLFHALTGRRPPVELVAAANAPTCVRSVGVEGTNPGDARLKVYFGLREACNLRQLGIYGPAAETLSVFLDVVLQDRSIPIEGLLFCMGISLDTGQFADAKVDLCGHCLDAMGLSSCHALARLFTSFEVPSQAFKPLLDNGATELAFLGCGASGRGPHRINIYLKGRRDAVFD